MDHGRDGPGPWHIPREGAARSIQPWKGEVVFIWHFCRSVQAEAQLDSRIWLVNVRGVRERERERKRESVYSRSLPPTNPNQDSATPPSQQTSHSGLSASVKCKASQTIASSNLASHVRVKTGHLPSSPRLHATTKTRRWETFVSRTRERHHTS